MGLQIQTRQAEARPTGKNSDQFVAGKEIAQFKRRSFRGVRTVRASVSEAGAEVAANRAWSRLGGIGGAHRLAPLQNRALGFESQHDDLAGTHEFGQLAEKRTRSVHGVKAACLDLRKAQRFDRDNLKSGLLNP